MALEFAIAALVKEDVKGVGSMFEFTRRDIMPVDLTQHQTCQFFPFLGAAALNCCEGFVVGHLSKAIPGRSQHLVFAVRVIGN